MYRLYVISIDNDKHIPSAITVIYLMEDVEPRGSPGELIWIWTQVSCKVVAGSLRSDSHLFDFFLSLPPGFCILIASAMACSWIVYASDPLWPWLCLFPKGDNSHLSP